MVHFFSLEWPEGLWNTRRASACDCGKRPSVAPSGCTWASLIHPRCWALKQPMIWEDVVKLDGPSSLRLLGSKAAFFFNWPMVYRIWTKGFRSSWTPLELWNLFLFAYFSKSLEAILCWLVPWVVFQNPRVPRRVLAGRGIKPPASWSPWSVTWLASRKSLVWTWPTHWEQCLGADLWRLKLPSLTMAIPMNINMTISNHHWFMADFIPERLGCGAPSTEVLTCLACIILSFFGSWILALVLLAVLPIGLSVATLEKATDLIPSLEIMGLL